MMKHDWIFVKTDLEGVLATVAQLSKNNAEEKAGLQNMLTTKNTKLENLQTEVKVKDKVITELKAELKTYAKLKEVVKEMTMADQGPDDAISK